MASDHFATVPFAMDRLRRRIITIPAIFGAAVVLMALAPLWIPVAMVLDVCQRRWRLPSTRLGLFALCWCWLEAFGVAIAALLWLAGQRSNQQAHHRLQSWWAASMMAALQLTTGIRVSTQVGSMPPGPAVMLCRHASLADSLVSAWAITSIARMRPRYVLKRELLADPCLDVVGHRLPNYFLDRHAADANAELDALTELARGMTSTDVTVIFPEGTRASASKRQSMLLSIAQSDQRRAQRLQPLIHLLPPRPGGAAAILAGCPQADVVIAWHSGFDGLDTFGGIIRHLAAPPPPIRFATWRVPRKHVPDDPAAFADWLDDQWLLADRRVDEAIRADANRQDPRGADAAPTDSSR